jgi:hypothetical protein
MWKYNGQAVKEGKAWITDTGIQRSPQWHLWSYSDKIAAGLVEITPETPPDNRLYRWTQNPDGTLNKTARPISDVKAGLEAEVKRQQGSLLRETDWVIIRKADTGTAVPSNVQAWRDSIRAKATDMEAAIDSAADTDAVAALFLSHDSDGNKSGILYDWPEIDT